jgi:Protein kinase domain/WD40-like Beta Propeller Repeat
VLDFGLAKAIEPEGTGRAPARVSSTMSPTIISPAMTQAGFILGTAAYMAPEQAKGRDVDARADIWAFGCVVFEMLTGRRAFPGDDVTDTLAAVVLRDPDWSALPSSTPDPIRRLLIRCLRKDPKRRLHHIADARQELDESTAEPVAAVAPPARARHPYSRLALEIAGAVVLVAAAVWLTMLASGGGSAPSGQIRFSIAPPPGAWVVDVSNEGQPLAEISPDGTRIVLSYRIRDEHIYSHTVDGSVAEPARVLDGPSDLIPHAVSPNGEWLIYQRNDPKLKGGLWALGLKNGSTPRMLIDTPADEGDAVLSPDGRWLAYRSDETGRHEVYVQAFPDGGNRVPVSLNGGQVPRWSRDSRELFFREGDKMMAVAVQERTFGRPSMLFPAPLFGYDVAADGRFLGVLRDSTVPQAPVNVVVNWFEELKRLVPSN